MTLELNKIYCGDCLDLMKEIPDKSIDLVLTDPPYNTMVNEDILQNGKTIVRRYVPFDAINLNIEGLIKNISRVLSDGGNLIIFCSDRQIGDYIRAFESQGLKYRNTLVWSKGSAMPKIRKNSFINQSEYICYGHKEGKHTFNFKKQSEMSNVLSYEPSVSFSYGPAQNGGVGEATGHPTQKPSLLIQHLTEVCSNEGDTVLDPFLGSGTTAVACKRTGRNFIGIEKEPKYVDIALKRLEKVNNRKLSEFLPIDEVKA